MVPAGVWMAMPSASGMLCDWWKNSEIEGAEAERRAGRDGEEVRSGQQSLLAQLGLDQAAGEGRGEDRGGCARQDIGEGTDVILMAVGDQVAEDPIAMLLQVGDIGDQQVHAEHRIVGKAYPGVDHDQVLAVSEDHHIVADLLQAAQGNRAQAGEGYRGLCGGGSQGPPCVVLIQSHIGSGEPGPTTAVEW